MKKQIAALATVMTLAGATGAIVASAHEVPASQSSAVQSAPVAEPQTQAEPEQAPAAVTQPVALAPQEAQPQAQVSEPEPAAEEPQEPVQPGPDVTRERPQLGQFVGSSTSYFVEGEIGI